ALFVRMVKKYNKHHMDNPLPHITPHALRHTFCSRCFEKGITPKVVQQLMGHAHYSTTIDI
ncbi:tyrosine-type recombinase/integrase, partial [Blautia producta]